MKVKVVDNFSDGILGISLVNVPKITFLSCGVIAKTFNFGIFDFSES